MTVLTAESLATQQANVETGLTMANTLRNQANLAANELCALGASQTGDTRDATMAQAALMRDISAEASDAWGRFQRIKKMAYGICIQPVGAGSPIGPDFNGPK